MYEILSFVFYGAAFLCAAAGMFRVWEVVSRWTGFEVLAAIALVVFVSLFFMSVG